MNNDIAGPFVITGASGQLGSMVVDFMLEAGASPLIATSRSPEKLSAAAARGIEVRAADFNQPQSLPAAFAGAKRLLLISTDDLEPGKRLAAHSAAIKAAVEAGVTHIVYTSLTRPEPGSPISFAPDHAKTEAMLADSGVAHTILRNNLYTDLLLMSAPQAIGMGQLFAAAADGKAGYVTREDCARAAAAALLRETETRTFDVTGPALVSHAELAAIYSEVSGKDVPYIPITVDDLAAAMIKNGLPEMMAKVFASFDVAIAEGYLEAQSTAVKDLTGQEPTNVRDYLVAHKAALTG